MIYDELDTIMFFSENLFDVLIQHSLAPGVASLRIISGYATSAMALRHLQSCCALRIELIVGMTSTQGISLVNHTGFCQLSSDRFLCLYNIGAPIHSKLYIWYNSQGNPISSVTGSANYTQQAFVTGVQNEILTHCDSADAHYYIGNIAIPGRLLPCTLPNIGEQINFYESVARQSIPFPMLNTPHISTIPSIELPLTDANGNVPERSGLNWGQRERREPNQAYIKIPANIAHSHFFPPRAVHFNVMTSDGNFMTMAVAQDGDKALHTPQDNSRIGRYFRQKLGVADGAPVTIEDLRRYGRNTVSFTKDDNENYYMVF